jgi:hypothetical protein
LILSANVFATHFLGQLSWFTLVWLAGIFFGLLSFANDWYFMLTLRNEFQYPPRENDDSRAVEDSQFSSTIEIYY